MHKPVNFASLTDSFILLLLRITETLILNVNAANTKQLSGPEKLLELPRNRPSPRSEKGCEKWHFLVWNMVRIWRTGRYTLTKNFQEYRRVPGSCFLKLPLRSEYLTEETTSTLDIQCETFISMLQSVIWCRCILVTSMLIPYHARYEKQLKTNHVNWPKNVALNPGERGQG